MPNVSNTAPKVVAATTGASITGSVTVVLVYILGQLGVDLPPEVSSAVTTILGAAGALVAGRIQAN